MTNVTETTMVGAPPMVVGFGNATLYVGDLEPSVIEEHLFEVFNRVAQVITVRVCRDQTTRRSLRYGYVNFSTPQDAAHAMKALNFRPVNGKPMRIMFSQRDPSLRKSGYANVFIKNLDLSIDNRALFETFSAYGTILSCKVAVNSSTGHSKGYGFVQFDKEDAAQNAIKSLDGMLLNDKKVYVGLFVRKQERYQGNECPKFTNVYVKNLSESFTDEELKGVFGEFGEITSCVVMKDGDGKSKGFGFVNFASPESAAVAVEKLNGRIQDERVWYVGRAQKKAEREAELKVRFEQERIIRYEKLQGANLYMKNLDDSINDEKLKEMFSEFGTITSCKIMRDTKGASKGSGFVAFSTPEEATRALTEMNGKMVERKPLYVAVAQRKDDRKARLQARFAQATVSQGFHPGAPRMPPQQLYFGAGNPALIPPQPPTGYGFQHQIFPGIRPGVGIALNYMMPFLPRQGPHAQRSGIRHGGYAQKLHHQQPMANHTPNQGFRSTTNAQNDTGAAVASQGIPTDTAHPPLSSVLMPALRSANLDEQRTILGEHLYPLVEKIDNENVGKVTGMLLEMDQPEVLHLIESPDALKEKVAEAVHVLHQVASSPAGETDITDGQLSLLPPSN